MSHYCHHGGYVVDGTLPLPDDPTDYAHPVVLDVIGCNQLGCTACGEAVTWALVGTTRTYRCSCESWTGPLYQAVSGHEADAFETERNLPWRCRGHAPATLPVDVDGATVDRDTDWDELADRVLAGWVPDLAGARAREVAGEWSKRLYSRMLGLPEGRAFGDAVGRRLSSPEPEVVGAAILFFQGFCAAPAFEALLELLEEGADPHQAWPIRVGTDRWNWTLLMPVLRRLSLVRGELDEGDLRAWSIAFRTLTDPSRDFDPDVLEALAATDGGELAVRSPEIVRSKAATVGKLLSSLGELDRDELVVVAGVALIDEKVGRPALKKWLALSRNRRKSWTPVLQQALDAQ
ncbi:MAG: hypothetical protein GY898_00880 [Proteobacteria bacterium]|nr:hypothetical protein [Pseudomonadota bacterium]